MMDEIQEIYLRLEILRLYNGVVDEAEEAFRWITGEDLEVD